MNQFTNEKNQEENKLVEFVRINTYSDGEVIEEEIKTISVKNYKPRFETVKAHKLQEDSTIHLSDESKLKGSAGDYYIILDNVNEFIIPEQIFKKLFILKVEE
ncbi:MAG: hypothetical protein RBS86_04845 [Candidatus Moranbacteria bacterium]|jgi:hypothetical protein|nr:hypothetical protein [Candidatus Moranbacteria bacterium]